MLKIKYDAMFCLGVSDHRSLPNDFEKKHGCDVSTIFDFHWRLRKQWSRESLVQVGSRECIELLAEIFVHQDKTGRRSCHECDYGLPRMQYKNTDKLIDFGTTRGRRSNFQNKQSRTLNSKKLQPVTTSSTQ